LILAAEPAPSAHLLHLLFPTPLDGDPRTDRAPIARRAFELDANPVTTRRHAVRIDEQWSPLIGHDRIERAVVVEIGEDDRSAVVGVGHTNFLRHVSKAALAVVEPDARVLIAGEAPPPHGR